MGIGITRKLHLTSELSFLCEQRHFFFLLLSQQFEVFDLSLQHQLYTFGVDLLGILDLVLQQLVVVLRLSIYYYYIPNLQTKLFSDIPEVVAYELPFEFDLLKLDAIGDLHLSVKLHAQLNGEFYMRKMLGVRQQHVIQVAWVDAIILGRLAILLDLPQDREFELISV
jgi:hypothetical protein